MQGLLIILFINYIGVILVSLLHIPLPGSVFGMLILFVLLYSKKMDFKYIKNTGEFLLTNMVVFFIPPTVGLIENYGLIKNDIFKIILVICLATFITMVVTGKVVDMILKRGENNEASNN